MKFYEKLIRECDEIGKKKKITVLEIPSAAIELSMELYQYLKTIIILITEAIINGVK